MSILNSILLYMIDTRRTKPRAGLAYYSIWLIQGLDPEPAYEYFKQHITLYDWYKKD